MDSFIRSKNIIITNNILNFLYNQSFFNESDTEENDIDSDDDDEITDIKQDYIKSLKKNDINFTTIKYSENLIKEYSFLEEDIKNLEPHNIVQKNWIYMTVKDFKESVMLLNTDNAKGDNLSVKEVKKYYITLEEILFDYMKYTKDYEIKKSEYEKIKQENKMLELESDFSNQLIIKDKELSLKDEKIKEKDEKVSELETKIDKLSENQLKFKKLLSNIKTHQTKGYIYIATTKEYAKNTIFKIGNTENLKKRQSNYQTGRSSLDSFYFCYYRETYYPKSIDKYIQLVLKEFKDKKNSEMYIIHFVKLKKLIDIIIDNYNKSFEEINKFIENELEESYDLDVFIPEPILL